MIVLGIDPGTRSTGYGIIRQEGSAIACVEYGSVQNKAALSVWECHLRIADGIARVIAEYAIDCAAVESQFFFKNPRTALRIGEARSVALLPVSRAGIGISEYSPARVKKAIVGSGSARKDQVQLMVKTLLNLKHDITPEDASDALAIAICHLHAHHYRQLL